MLAAGRRQTVAVAAALPQAFGELGLLFAASYVALQVGTVLRLDRGFGEPILETNLAQVNRVRRQ